MARWSIGFSPPAIGVLISISLILFPFYRKVYLKNENKDKDTPIFIITNHFYKALRFLQIINIEFILLLIAVPLANVIDMGHGAITWYKTIHAILSIILMLSFLILILHFVAITSVCAFLVPFLAFHRFCLYFFPPIGELMTPKRKHFLLILYIIVPPFSVCGLISDIFLFLTKESIHYDSTGPPVIAILTKSYNIFQLLSFLMSIPYLIMIISIKKFKSQMFSGSVSTSQVANNKPENFIMIQIIITTVTKFFELFCFEFWNSSDQIHRYMFCMTMLTISPMIQISYLLCNKSNFVEFSGMFRFVWRKINFLVCRKAYVEPTTDIALSTKVASTVVLN